MTKNIFVIPSLVAAGFVTGDAKALMLSDLAAQDNGKVPLIDTLRLPHRYHLAAHRSHQSHRSHRSSSGGGYRVPSPGPSIRTAPSPAPAIRTAPSRNRQSTPPSSVLPSSPAIAPKPNVPAFKTETTPQSDKKPTLPGNSKKFVEILKRVQAGLYVYGYYTSAIDGVMGPETRAAISKYQKDYKLPVTGTITPEVLNAFGITAQ